MLNPNSEIEHFTDRSDEMLLLEGRAAALARELRVETAAEEQIEVVPFLLGDERYAIEQDYVRRVWPLGSYVPIPNTPPFILGVANVHGEICSIVDLHHYFGLPSQGLSRQNKLIILEADEMFFGILVDEVFGVERIARSELSTAEGWQQVSRVGLVGITTQHLIVLNALRILKDERLIINEVVPG